MLSPHQLSVEGTRSAYGRALNTVGESPYADHMPYSCLVGILSHFPLNFLGHLKICHGQYL